MVFAPDPSEELPAVVELAALEELALIWGKGARTQYWSHILHSPAGMLEWHMAAKELNMCRKLPAWFALQKRRLASEVSHPTVYSASTGMPTAASTKHIPPVPVHPVPFLIGRRSPCPRVDSVSRISRTELIKGCTHQSKNSQRGFNKTVGIGSDKARKQNLIVGGHGSPMLASIGDVGSESASTTLAIPIDCDPEKACGIGGACDGCVPDASINACAAAACCCTNDARRIESASRNIKKKRDVTESSQHLARSRSRDAFFKELYSRFW
jgi:hypothetical protein